VILILRSDWRHFRRHCEAWAPPARRRDRRRPDILAPRRGRLPGRALVSASELRDPLPADLVAAALTQQSPRMAARAKFSRADVMYFTRDALEPTSSELTAGDLAGHWRLR